MKIYKISQIKPSFPVEKCDYDKNGNMSHCKSDNGNEYWQEWDENNRFYYFKDNKSIPNLIWYEYDENGFVINTFTKPPEKLKPGYPKATPEELYKHFGKSYEATKKMGIYKLAQFEYLYHGTSEGSFRKIRQIGLIPEPNKFIYLSDTEQYAESYAQRKGNPYGNRILRVKRTNDMMPDSNTGFKGDFKTNIPITPDKIEVKVNNQWIPIKLYHNEQIGIMPIASKRSYLIASDESDSETYMCGYDIDDPNQKDVAAVNWEEKDLQILAEWNEQTVKDFLGLPKNAIVYKSLIPLSDLNEKLAEEEDSLGGEDDGFSAYDWSELRSSRTNPPPILITRTKDNKIVINDGNHRVRFWSQKGHQYAPAWVYDELLTLKHSKRFKK